MNPSPNRQAVIVGLFTATALAILGGGILTIGDLNDTFTKKLRVTAIFDEVGGLQEGDNVWFSGVKVGTVKALGLHTGSSVRVELKIDRSAAPFIHSDALARIGSDGLIGNRIVVLYGGGPSARPIIDGDELAIGHAVSTEAIMETLQANNQNLLAITADLKGISARVAAGDGTVGKLLRDDDLYVKVSDTVTSLESASSHARDLTASLSTFSAKLNRPGSLPDSLVTDRTSYASLTSTVGDLHRAGESVAGAMDGLATSVRDPTTPVGTLLHDQEAAAQLKATLENLNRGSALLADDLEAAQHNFLLRGFFKKREKAERHPPPSTGAEPANPQQ